MIRTSPALSNFPLWDTGDVIANFIPFVASGESATALTQQPQHKSQPDQWPQRPSVSVLNVQATLTWKRPVRHFQIRASWACVGGRKTWNYSQRKLSRGCDKIYDKLNVIYNHLPTNSQCWVQRAWDLWCEKGRQSEAQKGLLVKEGNLGGEERGVGDEVEAHEAGGGSRTWPSQHPTTKMQGDMRAKGFQKVQTPWQRMQLGKRAWQPTHVLAVQTMDNEESTRVIAQGMCAEENRKKETLTNKSQEGGRWNGKR